MGTSEIFEIGGIRIISGEKIEGGYVNSPDDAKRIYKYIGDQLKKYKLDDLLKKIHDETIEKKFPNYNNFILSAMAKYVLLNSKVYGELNSISDDDFLELLSMVTDYELYDPQFHEEFKKNPKRTAASFMLKTIGQSQWDRNIHFMLSRALFLYEELIKEASAPEFIKNIVGSKFEEQFGLPLNDFIKIGAVLWAGSISHKGGMRRDYLDKARDRGMTVPNDNIVKICLKLLVCDPLQFRNDPLFKKYNINPLLSHPLVRLWENSEQEAPFDDKFIAPIPDMIMYRITIGLYYQLYNIYGKEFATNFGDLFELYVSKIIEGYKLPGMKITDRDIDTYLLNRGNKGGITRRPDWIIFTDRGVILIECKATHYTQDTFEHGVDARDMGWLTQIRKSLDQFDKFEKRIPELCKKLGISYANLDVQKVIVSFEPLLGLKNGGPIREFIDGKNKRDWTPISVEEMEAIQPYIAKGYDLWSFISEYKNTAYHDFDNIMEKMRLQTGAADSENMFHPYRTKVFDELLKDVHKVK